MPNAYLVEVDSEEENTFVVHVLKGSRGTVIESTTNHSCHLSPFSGQTWIGLSDQKVERHFVWAHSGANLSFTNWAAPNPDNWYDREDCVHLIGSTRYDNLTNKWNDDGCTCNKPYVCEMETRATTTIAAATTEASTTAATTAATTTEANTTAATTLKDPKTSWIVFAVGFAATGLVTVLVISGVVCAVRRRKRRNSNGSNNRRESVIACVEEISTHYGQDYYSEAACEDFNNTASHHYPDYRRGQVHLAKNDEIYVNDFSEKLSSSAVKSSANNYYGQQNYTETVFGDFTSTAAHYKPTYRQGRDLYDDEVYDKGFSEKISSGVEESSANNYSETAYGDFTDSAAQQSLTYRLQHDHFADDEELYDNGFSEKISSAVKESSVICGQKNYGENTCGYFTDTLAYQNPTYRHGQDHFADDDEIYENCIERPK